MDMQIGKLKIIARHHSLIITYDWIYTFSCERFGRWVNVSGHKQYEYGFHKFVNYDHSFVSHCNWNDVTEKRTYYYVAFPISGTQESGYGFRIGVSKIEMA